MLTAASLGICGIGCSERMVEEYATQAEASNDKAVERGLIPPALPECARRIRVVHDVDDGNVWGAFDCGADGASWLEQAPLASAEASMPARLDDPWWPGNVPLPVRHLNGSFLAAWDRTNARILFWRPSI